ncbi:MAG: hypothetical protein WBB82_10215 [Limnothrix sp.]
MFHIAKDYGFKYPERESNYSHQWDKKDEGDRQLSPTEFGVKKASEFMAWVNEKVQKAAPTFKKLLKVTQNPITEPPKVIHWRNGDPVPTREDCGAPFGDSEAASPIPKIIYAPGSNPMELIAKLRAVGWESVLDSSFMGDGKTHRAGMVKFDKCLGWYIDTDHNNPSVENIERNYTNLWARHNGLWRGDDGKLTRKAIEGKKPEVRANCPSADLFPKLAAKGYDVMGSKDNPICGVCPHRGYCHTDPNFFKAQRANALAQQQIRSDIQSLPNPNEWDYTDNYAIVEEATTQARASLTEVSGTWSDLLQNLDDMERNAPETYEKLKPFKDALRHIFEADQGRYGLDHDTITAMLPMGLGGDVEAILESVLLAIAPELAFTEADRVSGAGKKYNAAMKSVNALYRGEAKEENERLLESLPHNLLMPLLTVWNEEKGSIRLEHNRLTVTQADIRKQETIKAFSFRLCLDATGNKQAIATGFGLKENSIIEIQQQQPALDNLTVYETHMSGTKSRKRSDSANKRIAAYQIHWRKIDPDVQFLGFKGEKNIQGWWLNHNRGSNKFKGRLNLVSFGCPYPHIGAIQAEYRTFNGSLDGFDEYYRRLVEDEIIQGIGRQRVQHYPGQKFNFDMVATYGDDFNLNFLTERYGIKVIKRDAVEFCEAAGTTAEKLKHGICEIAKGIAAAGEKLTQQAIATAMGISQQALSKHIKALWGNWLELKKLLQLFLKGSNRDGCKNSEQIHPIEPMVAAATLIDIFSQGSWQALRAFLEDMPLPEARYWLGCLLTTAAIA